MIVHHAVVRTYAAMAILPFATQDRASAVLRANLRFQLGPGEVADWATLDVTGPTESVDLRGRTWFHYRASVRAGS